MSGPRHTQQIADLPALQPAYVLRGHTAQIHAVHFLRGNLRLLSGDAEGWVVIWSVPLKRPAVVWRAHSGSVVGLGNWDDDRLITFVQSVDGNDRTQLTSKAGMVGTTSCVSGRYERRTKRRFQRRCQSKVPRQRGRSHGSCTAYR